MEVLVGEKAFGFIKKGDLAKERTDQRMDRFALGEKVDARIVSIDSKNRKLNLSIKALEVAEEKQATESNKPRARDSDDNATTTGTASVH